MLLCYIWQLAIYIIYGLKQYLKEITAISRIIYGMNTIFKERLNEVLAENNLSQNALAKRIFMSQCVVNNYCTGKREPSLDVLITICKELNVSADYLLGLTD